MIGLDTKSPHWFITQLIECVCVPCLRKGIAGSHLNRRTGFRKVGIVGIAPDRGIASFVLILVPVQCCNKRIFAGSCWPKDKTSGSPGGISVVIAATRRPQVAAEMKR